jgi:hypothetical protein
MIHGNTVDDTPRNVGSLKAVNHPHHVICSAGGLPVIELLACHFRIPLKHINHITPPRGNYNPSGLSVKSFIDRILRYL